MKNLDRFKGLVIPKFYHKSYICPSKHKLKIEQYEFSEKIER